MVLKINNLTKSFGGVKAVDNLSIEFRAGKITSLIGPNGAGKTTLFNLISGFIKPDKGEIELEVGDWQVEDRGERQEARSQKHEARGKKQEARRWKMEDGRKGKVFKIHKMEPSRIAQLGIGRLFQDVRVFKKMKCIDNILVSDKDLIGENPLEAVLFFHRVNKREKRKIEKAEEILNFVGLSDKKDVFAEDLSYGQQKLLCIARLLYSNSNILLLDEPTAGVSPAMTEKILSIIKELAEKMNKMVIVIEHNMNVVYRISNWVYFMNEGSITAFGTPEDVLGNEEVKRIYIGL